MCKEGNRLKVLEVFGEPISNGGQESFVVNLISHMNMSNLKIDLLTPYYCDNDHYRKTIEKLGGNIFELNNEFNPGKSRFNINDSIDNFFKNNNYDVVHVHSGSVSILCIIANYAKKYNVKKVIVHSHCGIEKETLKSYILKKIGSFSLKKNVDIYCACSEIAGKAKFTSNIVKNKLMIIDNGIDLPLFKYDEEIRQKKRKELGINEDEFLIGHIGRFAYQKNHDYLIDIFNALVALQPKSKLLLIGEGELMNDVKKKVQDLQLSDKVIFYGTSNDINQLIQAMDIFVLPSRFEGLPIVLVETQASGLPIVCSDAISDEAEITDAYVKLPVENVDIWVKNILKYNDSKMKSDGRKLRVNKYFDCDNMTENVKRYDVNVTSEKVRNLYLK